MGLLVFSVYIGSAIYTPSIPGVMEDFGVSQTKAVLGLSLYVLAYGMGPMVRTSHLSMERAVAYRVPCI